LAGPTRPLGSPEIPQVFLPSALKTGTYSPRLYAAATVRFRDRKRKIEEVAKPVAFLLPLVDAQKKMDWESATPCPVSPAQLLKDAPVAAPYLPLPASAMQLGTFTRWAKNFDRWLARTQKLDVTTETEPPEQVSLSPRRGGVSVDLVAIAWELL
jgi:hypothetical protein